MAVNRTKSKKPRALPTDEQLAEYNRLGGGKTAEGKTYRRKMMVHKKDVVSKAGMAMYRYRKGRKKISPMAKVITKSKKKSKIFGSRQKDFTKKEDESLRGALGTDYAKYMKRFTTPPKRKK